MIQVTENMSLFLPEKYLDFLLTFIVFIICPFFLILTVFCCGKIYFTLNGFIPLRRRSATGSLLKVDFVLAMF